jgi:hypothetical protein
MIITKLFKTAGVIAAFTAIIVLGMMNSSRRVRALDDQGDDDREEARIRRGLAIAPVPLHYEEKDKNLVGLGSYFVNAVVDCNGCHSAGPATYYIPTGNPYLLSPPFTGKIKINPATYLAGGRDFGPVGSVPHLYSRNLTPDKTGLPEGGHTFEEFLHIMHEGRDYDNVHPNCTSPGTPANCLEPPFNGGVLQVMPWPILKNVSDHDLKAIYEYLKALECNPGPVIDGAPYLQNACS